MARTWRRCRPGKRHCRGKKGRPIVLETMRQLEALGIPPVDADGFRIRVIPFLDKNDPRQRKELLRLYLDSDLFLLPSRIEAFGISLIEACACGLPVISTDVGGVSELVREGESGYVLPHDAGGRDYARLITDIFRDDVRYKRFCRSGRQEYEERLNWDAWGVAVRGVIEKLLPSS
jgi:glycosyltransferase involved in cell wall biosynthesis